MLISVTFYDEILLKEEFARRDFLVRKGKKEINTQVGSFIRQDSHTSIDLKYSSLS